MRKKSVAGWVAIGTIATMSVACIACSIYNKALAFYGIGYALLARMLYREEE